MLLYRIEDVKGHGPYGDRRLGLSSVSTASRPSPAQEGLAYTPGLGYRFAFINMDQLNRWFTARDMHIMDSHGYGIVEYEVDISNVRSSSTQCIFVRDAAVVTDSEHW